MSNELSHHGIKGMHWGVRRYQNADGSLTSAGKAHALTSSKKQSENLQKNGRVSREQIKSMSDKELAAKIQRLEMEKRYKDLDKATINDGERFVKEIMSSIGRKTLTTAGIGSLLYLGKYAVTKEFDPVEFGNAIFNGGPKKK